MICALDLLFLSLFSQLIKDRIYEPCNMHSETKIIYIIVKQHYVKIIYAQFHL